MKRGNFRIAAGALLGLLAAACGEADKPSEPILPPAVEAVRIQGARPDGAVQATGRVARRREMDLSFRIPGVMTRLTVEAGDRVAKGQVLATLDPAGVAAAEQRSSADLERVSRDLARDQALFEKGFVSRARLDDRASAVKAAQAAYDAAAFDRRWARLVSPAAGVVLARAVQSGEVVQPGQTVVRIADEASPLVVKAPAPDRDARRVEVGARAVVRLDNLGPERVGRVTRIGQSAGERTGAVDIEIELPPGTEARSGQVADVRIEARAASGGVGLARLPAEAILEAQGRRATVFLVEPGASVARRRVVTFAGFDGDDALVSGLPAGVEVITAGAGFVSDGEKVRVIDPARLLGAAAPR